MVMAGSRAYHTLSPEAVQEMVQHGADVLLLDVRTPGEFAAYHIPGAVLLPVQELAARAGELDRSRPIICVCEHGIRSEAAAEFLARQGFVWVATMQHGMVRWAGAVERG